MLNKRVNTLNLCKVERFLKMVMNKGRRRLRTGWIHRRTDCAWWTDNTGAGDFLLIPTYSIMFDAFWTWIGSVTFNFAAFALDTSMGFAELFHAIGPTPLAVMTRSGDAAFQFISIACFTSNSNSKMVGVRLARWKFPVWSFSLCWPWIWISLADVVRILRVSITYEAMNLRCWFLDCNWYRTQHWCWLRRRCVRVSLTSKFWWHLKSGLILERKCGVPRFSDRSEFDWQKLRISMTLTYQTIEA
jgi:hypothetical protein